MHANSTAGLSTAISSISSSGAGQRATDTPLIDPAALYRRQVQEAYASLKLSASISLFAAALTLMVLGNSGDLKAGLYWFVYACAVFVFRFTAASRFQSFKLDDATFPSSRNWETLLILGNVLVGLQWGVLGTLLFNSIDIHRQMFIVLVIVSYVGSAMVPFNSLKWAHPALAIPAAIPPTVYIFFMMGGTAWVSGTMALLFIGGMLCMAQPMHKRVVERLSYELENQALLERLSAYNNELGHQNIELKSRTDAVLRSGEEARRQADALASHVQQTLLPVITCTPEFLIVEWNDAAEALLGYRATEVVGDNMGELLFPNERRANIGPYLHKLFRDKQPSMIEFPALARDGQKIPVRYYVTPIFGDDGEPLRISVIIIESYAELGVRRRRAVSTTASTGYSTAGPSSTDPVTSF
jgi:PAS domain S-box-containing protein